ncbi:MAG: hypothetical protein AAF985_24200 [Bacteroidota bacterium]
MITYEQVKKAMNNPPTEDMVHMYNDLGDYISEHPLCVNDDNPFSKLNPSGNFCISATSIQSKYIAFVLGKHMDSQFPEDVIHTFFNIDNCYKVQFGQIKGKEIDGCICLIHQERSNFDLQKVYDHIYR